MKTTTTQNLLQTRTAEEARTFVAAPRDHFMMLERKVKARDRSAKRNRVALDVTILITLRDYHNSRGNEATTLGYTSQEIAAIVGTATGCAVATERVRRRVQRLLDIGLLIAGVGHDRYYPPRVTHSDFVARAQPVASIRRPMSPAFRAEVSA